jgi:succinyl-diaminopimelate desuccinylase
VAETVVKAAASNIHAGTGASNVIPGSLEAQFNFRFSPASTRERLQAAVHEVLDRHGLAYTVDWTLSGPPFMTARGRLVDALVDAIAVVASQSSSLSTSGGTSDGRFLADVAHEVVEFGPMNDTIHKVDECVSVSDLTRLADIFERVVRCCLAD